MQRHVIKSYSKRDQELVLECVDDLSLRHYAANKITENVESALIED